MASRTSWKELVAHGPGTRSSSTFGVVWNGTAKADGPRPFGRVVQSRGPPGRRRVPGVALLLLPAGLLPARHVGSEARRRDAGGVLTTRSGIEWATPGQTYDDDAHPTVVLEASDEWIAYAAGCPMAEDPRTRFDYNDGVSVLLGKIVREATGARMDEWAAEHLFRPIGIDEHYWKITPDGEADT